MVGKFRRSAVEVYDTLLVRPFLFLSFLKDGRVAFVMPEKCHRKSQSNKNREGEIDSIKRVEYVVESSDPWLERGRRGFLVLDKLVETAHEELARFWVLL